MKYKNYYLFLMFFVISCSLYDLSGNQLGFLFGSNTISLLSPSLESPIVNDELSFIMQMTSEDGIKEINVVGSDGYKTNAIFLTPPTFFELSRTRKLSNINDYHTTNKSYVLTATILTVKDFTMVSEFKIPIQIASIHRLNITHPIARPAGGAWTSADKIVISLDDTGAGVQSVQISGNIINSAGNTLTISPRNFYNTIEIPLNSSDFTLPNGQLIANIRVTATSGVISALGWSLP